MRSWIGWVEGTPSSSGVIRGISRFDWRVKVSCLRQQAIESTALIELTLYDWDSSTQDFEF